MKKRIIMSLSLIHTMDTNHPWHQNYQNWSLFFGMNHQKSIFLLINDTLAVRGCWGQLMLLFWKLVEFPNLLNSLGTMIQDNYESFYLSGPFTLARFHMRHPVYDIKWVSYTMRRNLLNWCNLVSISKKSMFYIFGVVRI